MSSVACCHHTKDAGDSNENDSDIRGEMLESVCILRVDRENRIFGSRMY